MKANIHINVLDNSIFKITLQKLMKSDIEKQSFSRGWQKCHPVGSQNSTWGGHYGPDSWTQSAVSMGLEIGSPKFMTVILSRFARSIFWKFFLKFLKNWYSKIFGVLERVTKIEKIEKNCIFWNQIILFLAEYELYMFTAIFWDI